MQKGDKVTYVPEHSHPEEGMIKEIHPDGKSAWVVYNCNDDWDDYENYTGALTNFRDLKKGWITKT